MTKEKREQNTYKSCAMCGKKNGARIFSHRWQSVAGVCSEECGEKFTSSSQYAKIMLSNTRDTIKKMKSIERFWDKTLWRRLCNEEQVKSCSCQSSPPGWVDDSYDPPRCGGCGGKS